MDKPEKLATYCTQDKSKQKHKTICIVRQQTQIRHEPSYKQREGETKSNTQNKTRALLSITGGKDEPNTLNETSYKQLEGETKPNIVLCGNSNVLSSPSYTEYLSHVCSVYRSHNPVLLSLSITYHRIINKIDTTGTTS